MTRAGSLCSGVGGLDLAIEAVFGAETRWQAEVDKHAALVLEKRWPGVPNLGDITAVDWSTVEPVDVLSGGTPCQDMSTAGRRAGMRDGTRSGLWSSMAAAIEAIRPAVVVWENVEGALSAGADSNMEPDPGCVGDGPSEPVLRAAGRVLGDLADLGYDAVWQVVAASSVGACHRRRRLFVVAVASDADHAILGRDRRAVHAVSQDSRGRDHFGSQDSFRAGPAERPVIDLLSTVRTSDANGAGAHGDGGVDLRTAVQLLPTTTAGDAKDSRNFREDGTSCHAVNPERWGRYAAAVARHEAMLGRPAPSPTIEGRNGSQVLSHRFTEWMMCWPDGWVSDLLDRRPGLRCCGNGVVPAQAAAAIRSMLPAFGTEVSR